MADFVVLIAKAPFGEEELSMQSGDVLGVFPTTHKFTESELAQYLVVPVTGVVAEKIAKLSVPQYANGEDTLYMGSDKDLASKMVAKRKYSIKLTDISSIAAATSISIDNLKLYDPTVKYQPLSDAKVKIDVTAINVITNKVTNTYVKDFK